MNNIIDDIKVHFKNKTFKNCGETHSLAFPINEANFEELLNFISGTDKTFYYSSIPADMTYFLGCDVVTEIKARGSDREEKTSRIIESIYSQFISNWSNYGLDSIPLFMGGMKFSPDEDGNLWDDYSDSDWFIPKFLFYRKGNEYFLVYNFIDDINHSLEADLEQLEQILNGNAGKTEVSESSVIIDSNISDAALKKRWKEKVSAALDRINRGEIQKIVLSREVKLLLNKRPELSELLTNLQSQFPRCYIFAFRKNDSIFIGASPEKLAKVSNRWVEADALAGSISRGRTPEEDAKFAEELLNSSKNLAEQKTVVDFISDSFRRFSDEILFDKDPIIRKLPNIQHLWTPIKARLRSEEDIFSILHEIHPTPAICGVPWNNAMANIRKMEEHNRGLFAGIIGWFNFKNEGEFAVAIRSALLKNDTVYAYAGCGIVEGSDPESEYEETELKLQSILSLFQNEAILQS